MKRRKTDLFILFGFLLLIIAGTVFVFTSSWYLAYVNNKPTYYFLLKHVLKVAIAIFVFLVGYSLPIEYLRRFRHPLMAISLLLLLAVLILPDPIAPRIGGAKRWLNLGFMNFQISELFKLATILFLSFSAKHLKDTGRFLIHMAIVFLGIGLIAIEPNISTAILLSLLALSIAFYAGTSMAVLSTIGTIAAMGAVIAILVFPHAKARIMSESIHYQVKQSLIGLAHGGLLGVGLGKGVEKFLYLPDAHTDFIFSIIGEEMGFVGALIVLLVVMAIILRGFHIAKKLYRRDLALSTLAFAISMNLALYSLGHVSVVVGLFPPTGIPMPFISYGGSNLLVNSFLLGILLQLSKEA